MKLDMSAKPDESTSAEGNLDEVDLDSMLEVLIKAEKIKADPVLYARVTDYGMSKSKEIKDFFDANKPQPPMSSVKDLRKKQQELAMKDMNQS